jgi:hypothetical protein
MVTTPTRPETGPRGRDPAGARGADVAPARAPVPDGPVAYRQRVARWGAAMGLVVPAVAMIAAVALYRLSPCDGVACVEDQGSWVLAAMALPTALLWGIPLEAGAGRYLAATLTSALVWAALGHLAARRATRRSLATWRTWWGEFAWFVAAVWVGVALGLLLVRNWAL